MCFLSFTSLFVKRKSCCFAGQDQRNICSSLVNRLLQTSKQSCHPGPVHRHLGFPSSPWETKPIVPSFLNIKKLFCPHSRVGDRRHLISFASVDLIPPWALLSLLCLSSRVDIDLPCIPCGEHLPFPVSKLSCISPCYSSKHGPPPPPQFVL